jgi:hypothetical protein
MVTSRSVTVSLFTCLSCVALACASIELSAQANVAIAAELRTRAPLAIASPRGAPQAYAPGATTLATPPVGITTRLSQDSARARSRRPFVVAGAVLGTGVALFLYSRAVDRSGDGDFTAPITIPLTLVGAAACGALVGWIAGGFAGAP